MGELPAEGETVSAADKLKALRDENRGLRLENEIPKGPQRTSEETACEVGVHRLAFMHR